MPENVSTILEVSTMHMTASNDMWLGKMTKGPSPIVVYPKEEYGYLILIPDFQDEPDEIDMIPREILLVLVYAKALGCKWVIFDRDADEHSELPKYEW